MAEQMVFISYAREDFSSAQRLYQDLKEAGLEPWIDTEGLRPGEKWEAAIKRAIKNSRYFIALLSSTAVSRKGFVNKEITEALEVLDMYPESEIFLIPARLNECQPAHESLSNLHWVDMFPSWEVGLSKLLNSFASEEASISLRRAALINLSPEDAMAMILDHDFYDMDRNPNGVGIKHRYTLEQNNKVVFDETTGLTWERFRSPDPISYDDVTKHIGTLNQAGYCGFNDWRLPTLEEAMSLMEPRRHEGTGFFMSSIFRAVAWIWTADSNKEDDVWVVFYNRATYGLVYRGSDYFVLPVR